MTRLVILSVVVLAATATGAHACDLSRDDCWDSMRPHESASRTPEVRGWVRYAKPEPRVIVKREVVVRTIEPANDFGYERTDHPGACKPAIEALSEVMHTIDNGKASARKAWMENVRWRYGERFMEADLARGMHFQCNRVTVPTTEGVIGAAVNKATYGLKCEVRAVPCAAPVVREDK
jgi:hypothetical protein